MNRPAHGLPFALTTLRLALTPLLLWIVRDGTAGLPYVAIILVAFTSDIFDGVIARNLGISTAGLRRYDSRTDLVFYATAAWTVWLVHPEEIRRVAPLLAVLITLELVRPAFDIAKFGKQSSYHSYSAKTFGVAVVLALVLLMGFGIGGIFITAAIALGILADIEGLTMSLMLPVWTHDVKSVFHARKLRGQSSLAAENAPL
ncbi:MAG TPA: CDP-alcohol phosphatidyltransferase family protein [Rhodothermia bacterium]|nr:CDP-alcohol phosphatidyltransferase family protein [Rhodothermia bacterium]